MDWSCKDPVCYTAGNELLLQNHDLEEREYPAASDRIREVLIHDNYLSDKDIETCLNFDIASLPGDAQYASICRLHDALIAGYETAEGRGGE